MGAVGEEDLGEPVDLGQPRLADLADRLPETENALVGEAVVDRGAGAAGRDEPGLAQRLEMLGGVGDGEGRLTSQVLDHDAKRLHFIHAMYHATEGYLAATNELMMMNIDYETRRSAPWPDWAMERLDKMAAAHKSLPVPAQAGRLIGIKRKE